MSSVQPDSVSTVPDGSHGNEPLRTRWVVFGVVALALMMTSLDQTAVATALPAIQRDLMTPLAWSSWTITIYSLGQVVAMPTSGRLADQFGRKRVFLIAVAVFTAASVLSASANHIAVLAIARVVQGLAAGAVLPSATGIVADQFGRNRDRAIGLFTSVFPIGAIVGPIVGGVLVTYQGWRSIFIVNIPMGVAAFALACWLVTEKRGRSAGRPDVSGIALLTVLILTGMSAVALAGVSGSGQGWQLPAAIGAGLLAVFLGWRFLRHIARTESPVVPMRLLRGRDFGTMNTINLLFGAAALGFAALVPVYAEERYDLLPLVAGGLLSARALGMIALSGASVLLLRRLGHRRLMLAGYSLIIIGLLLVAAPAPGSPVVWLTVAAGVTGLGMGMAAPATNNASLHLAPKELSAVTGLRGMFRQTGSILAISITSSILTLTDDPGTTQAWIFAAFAVLLTCTIPLIYRMTDHRGSW